jgi:opine dehydrogenase
MVSIAVLGAGNSGCSLAAEMTLQGHDVALAELPQFKKNLEMPMKKGGIEVAGNLKNGFAKVKKITFDIKDAIKGSNLIFVTSPAFGHEAFTRACAPHLENGQALVYISYYGALRMAKLLKELGVPTDKVTVAETASFIYACDRVGKKGALFMERYQDDSKVLIKREKDKLPFAALPATKTAEALRTVNELFSSIVAANNVLETSINNINPIGHPAATIMNAGWIEHTGGKFSFYLEGHTPSINKVSEKMDEEKMAIAAAVGLKKVSNEEWTHRMYAKYMDKKTGSYYEEKYYKNAYDAPPNLKHRYLTEDIPYGLVPLCSIAKVTEVQTPTLNAIITLADIVNEVDYMREGQTLKRLGLEGMSPSQIVEFVNKGY